MPIFALLDSLSLHLAISFCSRSLFVCPCSPVCSLSRTSFLFFPFEFFSFLIQGFFLGPVVAPRFSIPVARFSVTIPFFIVIGLLLFFFGAWLGSLLFLLGVRALGRSSHSSSHHLHFHRGGVSLCRLSCPEISWSG